MENFNKTLKNYFAGQGLTQSDVAEKLQISRTVATNYLNGIKPFGRKAAMKWANTFNLDEVWLLTQGKQGTPPDGILKYSVPTVDPEIINIPIINIDARGGFLANNEVDVDEYTIDTMPFSRNLATEGDVVIPVFGDSMSPRYPSGSYILIRPLPLWREWLEFGQSYVLELTDQRRTIKIVRKGTTPNTYRLDSYNVDYDSTEISINLIMHVFQVLAVVKRETI